MPNGAKFLEGSFEAANQLMANLANELVEEFELTDLLTTAYQGREVVLTAGAFLTLLVPIIEAAELQERRSELRDLAAAEFLDVRPEDVLNTVTSLLSAVEERAAPADAIGYGSERSTVRSSLSVIQATHTRWCRIPPICGRG